MNGRAWTQLAMVLGEGGVLLISGGATYVLLSRLGGAEILGQYSVVLAWLLLFQALGSFGIPEFVARELGRSHHGHGRHMSHGLALGVVGSGAAMIAMVATVGMLGYEDALERALVISGFALGPGIVDGIARAGFLACQKTQYILGVRVIEVMVVLPANTYLILSGHGIEQLAIAMTAGKLLAAAAALYALHRHAVRLEWRLDAGFCRRLLAPLTTFWMSTVFGLIAVRVNVIVLSLFVPMSVVGLYAAAGKVVDVLLIVPVAFAQFMLPQFARTFAATGRALGPDHRAPLYALGVLMAVAAVAVFVFAESVVVTLFGTTFAASAVLLRLLVVALVCETVDMISSMILKAAGRQNADVAFFAVNPITNAGLSVVLIPAFGAAGAAVAKVTGVVASATLRSVFAFRHASPSRSPSSFAATPIAAGARVALVGRGQSLSSRGER
jgi:O-antigen/teichoic acid export membrane protein